MLVVGIDESHKRAGINENQRRRRRRFKSSAKRRPVLEERVALAARLHFGRSAGRNAMEADGGAPGGISTIVGAIPVAAVRIWSDVEDDVVRTRGVTGNSANSWQRFGGGEVVDPQEISNAPRDVV